MIPVDETPGTPAGRLRARLAEARPLLAAELRPPRRDLRGHRALEAWVDVHHAVRRMATTDTVVFLTDNAVGTDEEENLSHLVRNLGPDAARDRIVPFLTLKHGLDYCLRFAERARSEGFPGLVVLGGDRHDGIPRCLPRAWQLRRRLREEQPGLLLGGWANPYRDPREQVAFLSDHAGDLDFVLTQVLSHHRPDPVVRFLDEARRGGLDHPLIAGVFYYRSARRRTLRRLAEFIPVPEDEVGRDFGERGLDPDGLAAATVRTLTGMGLTRFYVSNLDTAAAVGRLASIASRAGLPAPGSGDGSGQPGPAGARRPRPAG